MELLGIVRNYELVVVFCVAGLHRRCLRSSACGGESLHEQRTAQIWHHLAFDPSFRASGGRMKVERCRSKPGPLASAGERLNARKTTQTNTGYLRTKHGDGQPPRSQLVINQREAIPLVGLRPLGVDASHEEQRTISRNGRQLLGSVRDS